MIAGRRTALELIRLADYLDVDAAADPPAVP